MRPTVSQRTRRDAGTADLATCDQPPIRKEQSPWRRPGSRTRPSIRRPKMAMDAPREELAYVAILEPGRRTAARMRWRVLDVDPRSSELRPARRPPGPAERRRRAAPLRLERLQRGALPDACRTRTSSGATCWCPACARRGMYIVDTKPDPRQPRIVKTIEPEELQAKSGYSRPHTIHCGPDAIYVDALGAPDGDGPGRHLPAGPHHLRGEGAVGEPSAGRSTWPTTSGGTWATTR